MQAQSRAPHDATCAALLFAHCWLLHTIGNLEHLGWIDKQRWFWPYELLGLTFKCAWWRDFLLRQPPPPVSPYSIFRLPLLNSPLMPVALQYCGRWGLYLRLLRLRGAQPRREVNENKEDRFETLKQPVEASAFLLAFVVSKLSLVPAV